MASYEIKLTGHNDLLLVENGDSLKSDWEAYKQKKKIDQPISIAGFTGMLSDIRYFRVAQGAQSNNNSAMQVSKEYFDELHKIRKMDARERANRIGFFSLIFSGFNGNLPDNEEIGLAKEVQKKFFTENPRRVHCDPLLFKEIIGGQKCHDAILRLVENVVRQDKFAEKHIY